MGASRLHQHNRADHVGVEGLEPIFAFGLGAVVEIGAGDVDEEVEPARLLDGALHQRGDIRVTGDVGFDEGDMEAEPCRGR